MEYTMKDCDCLVLISSESCNLACSYCEMANNLDVNCHAKYAREAAESFENGQYLKTLEKAFYRLHIDPLKIKKLELWGQEPTLTLDKFTEFFPTLYAKCPNIEDMFFSTNGVSGYEKITNFIESLSGVITKHLSFKMQFSYDGYTDTKEKRGIDPNIILNNIYAYCEKLNETKISPLVDVEVGFHCVINYDTIHKFANEDNATELLEYLSEFQSITDKCTSIVKNPRVEVCWFGPALQYPFNATKEQGQELVKFYNNCEKTGEYLRNKLWRQLVPFVIQRSADFPYSTGGKNFIKQLMTCTDGTKIRQDYINQLSFAESCGYSTGALKIRYDGTMMHCQSAIIGLHEDELKGKKGLTYDTQRNYIKHGFYPNVFTATDEELNDYLYFAYKVQSEQIGVLLNQTINLMVLLMNSNQISEEYKTDPEKFMHHAYLFTLTGGCHWNNMVETGSIMGRTMGWMRLLLNGFMDICEEREEETIKMMEESKGNRKGCVWN